MTVKRFIAGATCPRCAELDKIRMYKNDLGENVRECVSCGFSDVMPEDGPVQELTTRVNKPTPGEPVLPHEDEVQVVELIDPKKKH